MHDRDGLGGAVAVEVALGLVLDDRVGGTAVEGELGALGARGGRRGRGAGLLRGTGVGGRGLGRGLRGGRSGLEEAGQGDDGGDGGGRGDPVEGPGARVGQFRDGGVLH